MRKFLSIALCAMMITSFFAINVSAVLPEAEVTLVGAEPEVVYLNQDFSDVAAKPDFTVPHLANYCASTVEDGVLKLTPGTIKSLVLLDGRTSAVIPTGSYVFEFDFCHTSGNDPASDNFIYITVKRAAVQSNNVLKTYSFKIPVPAVFNGAELIGLDKWYTYRITVDESRVTTTAAGVVGSKVEYAVKGSNNWSEITYDSTGGNLWKNQTGYTYSNRAETTQQNYYNAGEIGLLVKNENKTYCVTAPGANNDFGKEVFKFDNIKIYKPAFAGTPESTPYPIKQGIVYTDKNETSWTGDGAAAKLVYSKAINWGKEPSKVVTTFDAVCTTAGGPITFATAGKEALAATTTIFPAEIGTWYNYKIIYSNDGSNMTADAVYRKEDGSNNWTLLSQAPDAIDVDGYDWFAGYNSGRAANTVRWFIYAGLAGENVNSNCAEGTAWTVKNVQITDGNAVTGKATVDGSNLTVELNTELWSAADVIVATYNGNKLANVNYAPVAITGNKVTVTVPYANGNTVKVYAWDSLATGKPVLESALDIR